MPNYHNNNGETDACRYHFQKKGCEIDMKYASSPALPVHNKQQTITKT
jgi:hypothetical protein